MMPAFVLCSDLDRTLIPNGQQAESPHARPCLRWLCALPNVRLVYVTGRDLVLARQAVDEYGLPVPDFMVCDVGSRVYAQQEGHYTLQEDWQNYIAADWQGYDATYLASLLQSFEQLELQELHKQSRFKLSFYTHPDPDETLLVAIRHTLLRQQLKAGLIWSIDEQSGQGLLDVLPLRANKLTAIRYLQQRYFASLPMVFAGDSGNDLPVLLSDFPSVLVANADPHTRQQAMEAQHKQLYFAQGNYLGMNGCYSAGVLEGLAYHLPEVGQYLEQLMRQGADYV